MNRTTFALAVASLLLTGCLTPVPPQVEGAWKGQLKTAVNTTINFTLTVRNQAETLFDCDLLVNAKSYPCSTGFGSVDTNGLLSATVQVSAGTELFGMTTGAIFTLHGNVAGSLLTGGEASLSGQGAPWNSATFTADR